MRRGLTSEDGLRSVKGMRDFLREAEEKRREMLKKYSPDSFKLTPEEEKALSDKLSGLAEKVRAYHEQMRNFMERLSGKYAGNMDEMQRRMQEAYQRHQELKKPAAKPDLRSQHAAGPKPDGTELSELDGHAG